MFTLASFLKPKACDQTMLPNKSTLKGQKLVENVKIENFKCDNSGDFHTMCYC